MAQKQLSKAEKLAKLRGKWSIQTLEKKLRKAKYVPRSEAKIILVAYFVNGQQQKDIITDERTKQAVSNCLHRFMNRITTN